MGADTPGVQRKLQLRQPRDDWSRIMPQAEGELRRKPSTLGLLDHSHHHTVS